jgi:putative ABC transport system ATP-binding protein
MRPDRAAFDKESASDMVDLLRRIGASRGMTALLVTHDNRILGRADRILTLEDGRIVGDEDLTIR